MNIQPAIKAYSYLRFSTPEQMQGDSFRRQTALAESYSNQHGLILDTSLTFQDAGVSAFRGRNAGPDGQLGAFLEAVRNGIVSEGSYLLVESLDRISRQTARKALRSLEDVVEAGAVVVTLVDGRKYDKESLDSDPVSLLLSILTFMRAHEESAMKASRLKAVWSEKRKQAVSTNKPMTSSCPAWIDLDKLSGNYRLIPERAEIVQRVFAMTLEGVGQGLIAQTFNHESLPCFGRGKFWHRTYIAKILENPAVIGVFIPHAQDHSSGKKVRIALDPIKDYFPSVIDINTYERFTSMRLESVQPRRGKHAAKPLNNIFGGLGKCVLCNSTMTMTNKGDGNKYLVCTKAKAGAGCKYKTLNYQIVEDGFLKVWEDLFTKVPNLSAASGSIIADLAALQAQINWLDETIATLTNAIESTSPPSATLLDRLGKLESDRISVIQQHWNYSLRLNAVEKNTLILRLESLRVHLQDTEFDKIKINALLRQIFKNIYICNQKKVLQFEWHHSDIRTYLRLSMIGRNGCIYNDQVAIAPIVNLAKPPALKDLS